MTLLTRIATVCAVGLCLMAPAQAQSVRQVLYGADGPAVRGLSYCYQTLAGRADRDALARQYGFQTPINEFGFVDVLDEPRGARRAWRVNYAGSTAGTANVPDDDALSMTVRLTERGCEATILAVPTREEDRVLGVAYQILEQLDPRLVPEAIDPFTRVLVAGTGPSWHGTIWLQHPRFDAGISFGPRIPPNRGAIWQVEINDRG